MECIGSFLDFDALIIAEGPRKDAIAGVDCRDASCATREQAVGESSNVASKVCTIKSRDIEFERVQGVIELFTGSGDEATFSHCSARLVRHQ